MTIFKIDTMKKHFVPENRLFSVEENNTIPLPEDLIEHINCYAFSIGCLYPGEPGMDYIPGFTTGELFTSNEDLIKKVCLDLANFDRHFRKLSFFGPKNLKDDEYLVKVFYSSPSEVCPQGEFHFIRQNRDTGIWYHMPGHSKQPCIIELVGSHVNAEPDELIGEDMRTFYYPLGYLAIGE